MKTSTATTLKVALDTSFAGVNPTGVGLYSRRLGEALVARQEALGLQVKIFGASAHKVISPTSIRTLSSEWPSYTQLALPLSLLRHKPNIIHSTSHIGPIFGPGKHIVTVHDLIFCRYPEDYDPIWLFLTRITLPLVLKRASAIIADSHSTKQDLIDFYGMRSGKIVVIYPGVDREYSTTMRYEPTNSINGKYVLCLGPWVRRKNLSVVVQAFARIAGDIPDLKLVITGNPSSGMKGYTQSELLGDLPGDVTSRIQLMGYVPSKNLVTLVAGASVLAYPSKWEGFGLPPLEAMSASVPVVASNTPAVAEVTGGAAILCDPDNAREWSGAIKHLLVNDRAKTDYIEKGYRRSTNFTWIKCADQAAQLYHRVAGSNRKGA